MKIKTLYIVILILFPLLFGCSFLRATGKTAKVIGKVGWGTAKVTGKVVKTTGKVAWKTGKFTSKSVRTVYYMAKGKEIIPLERKGNSLYLKVRLNRKEYAKFILDTGASKMQISKSMARKLGIRLDKGDQTLVSVASGAVMSGTIVKLREVRVGSVRVKNVDAIVLDYDNLDTKDGLLGMSFLNHFDFQINTKKPELILKRLVE